MKDFIDFKDHSIGSTKDLKNSLDLGIALLLTKSDKVRKHVYYSKGMFGSISANC
jgi:hypothetical protein